MRFISDDNLWIVKDRIEGRSRELRHYIECLWLEDTITERTKDRLIELVDSLDPTARSDKFLDNEFKHPVTFLFDNLRIMLEEVQE